MSRISQSDLQRFVARYEAHQGSEVDLLVRCYLAAAEVLKAFFGPTWVFQHVFGQGEGSPFLRSRSEAESDRYRHQDRVIALADALFNLQDIEGFEERIARMHASDVESLVAELDGAKLLVQSGIRVRFVEEVGRRGSDYDLEVQLAGTSVACETKCKVETTDLTEATVKNVLSTARAQLPADRPGVVFLKIPEMWVRRPEVASVLGGAVAASLRSTGRISAVIFHWETWHGPAHDGAARVTRFYTEHNPQARWPLVSLGGILSPSGTSNWQHLVWLAARW